MSNLCQKCKKLRAADFDNVKKRVENYPDFENLAFVIQHGLKEFIAKYVRGESNDLSRIF